MADRSDTAPTAVVTGLWLRSETHPVTLLPPTFCLALCPGTMKDLTDQIVVSTLEFDGTIWRDGGKVDIPPGEYTVTARFRYDTELVEKSRVVTWVDR